MKWSSRTSTCRSRMPAPSMELIAKTPLPLSAVAAPLRKAVANSIRRYRWRCVGNLASRIDDALQEDRFNLLIMAGFSGAALLLAAMGVYGAVAYAAEQRRREFGVRLALGADGRRLVRMAIGDALRIAAMGAAAAWRSRSLSRRLPATRCISSRKSTTVCSSASERPIRSCSAARRSC